MKQEIINNEGFSTFELPSNTCTNDDGKAEQAQSYTKGGKLKLDYKGRVLLQAKQSSSTSNLRSAALFILGNPEAGEQEFESFTSTSNITGHYLSSLFDSSTGSRIETDVKGNMVIECIEKLIFVAKQLSQVLENFQVTATQDINLASLKATLKASESILMSAEFIGVSGNTAVVNATQSLKLLSSNILLGTVTNDFEDNEKVGDSLVTITKFGNWWEATLKPLVEELQLFITRYNEHVHLTPSGMSERPLIPFELSSDDILSKAETTEKLKSSRTVRAI